VVVIALLLVPLAASRTDKEIKEGRRPS
jgi:hypothetical protein